MVHRGDPDYERVRHALGWNEIKPERYPDLVVQVASENDVIETVNFAREVGVGPGDRWRLT